MQFWAVILIIYFAGAFLLRDNFSEMLFKTDEAWWVALIAIGLIGTAFAGAIRNFLSFLSEERHRLIFAFTALFCIGGIEFLNAQYTHTANQNATAALAIVPGEIEIQRSWDGHFRAIAQINQTDVGLLIDTGASLVLLRHDDAVRMNLPMDALDFSTPLTTASGRSFVAPLILDSLSIGNVTVYNVRAAVAQQGALHSSLLGMSFLENLHEAVIQRNRMILRE